MKTYDVVLNVTKEDEALKICSEHGKFLSSGGGFPVCPRFGIWEGTEEGAELLKETGSDVTLLPQEKKKRARTTEEQVMDYVAELMGDGAFDSCSAEEQSEIRSKFESFFAEK